MQTDRQAGRDTDRQTGMQTETQTYKQTDTQTHRQTDRQRHRQRVTHRQTETQTDRDTGREKRRQTDRDTDRHTETQAEKGTQTDSQTDGWVDLARTKCKWVQKAGRDRGGDRDIEKPRVKKRQSGTKVAGGRQRETGADGEVTGPVSADGGMLTERVHQQAGELWGKYSHCLHTA